MAFKTLAEIQVGINRLAKLIGAQCLEELPTYGYSEGTARPHVEVDQNGYHYVVVERGQEWERITTKHLDELLYRVFRSVTLRMAIDYELKHRVEGQDSRRVAFQHQLELLSTLSAEWAQRCSQEIAQILHEHPFEDLGSHND